MKNPKVIGVLLCFYEEYQHGAVREFTRLLRSISSNYSIVIVATNKTLYKRKSAPVNDVHIITGDNTNWEFSGWDSGIKYVTQNLSPSNNDICIFANDTFCHHRPYGLIERFLFSRAFRRLRNDNLLVGEANRASEPITLNGETMQMWISSYLFGLNFQSLKKVCPLNKMGNDHKGTASICNSKVVIDNASQNLSDHLTKWLFPEAQKGGWYKSKNESVKLLKLQSILNEKYLTCYAQKNDITLYNLYSHPLIFKIKYHRSILWTLKKRILKRLKPDN